MSDLPAEVIADILSRLPVKPLLRFRCVSKPWCALIDSSHFIKTHLNRSIETNANLNLIIKDDDNSQLYSVIFDSLDCAVTLNDPLKCEHSKTEVWGSCNGLLCLSNTEDIVLWNPSTRKCRKLPVTPIETPLYFCIGNNNVVYGFGYDSIGDDYKVLRIVQFHSFNDDYIDSQVEVYSLKSNSWRRVQNFPHCLALSQECGKLACGALHWVVTVIPLSDTPDFLIIAFDFRVEEYRFVPLPKYSDLNFPMKVEVLSGCLCVLCDDCSNHVDIWVMKDYGVKESWIKLISIFQMSWLRSFENFKPIAYSKSSGEILLECDSDRFLWCDLKKRRFRNVTIGGMPEYFETNICLGSLVSLNGDGGSDVKKQQAQEKRKKKINRKKRDDFLSVGFKLVL